MKDYWLILKTWWLNLALREKRMVTVGGVLLVLFILYEGIWSPFLSHIDLLRKQIVAEKKLLVWMQAADQQLQMTGNTSAKKSLTAVALLSFMQQQINQAGLKQQLLQLKQVSSNSVEVNLQKAEFDKVIAMLSHISNEQAISISQISVVAEASPGVVNADMVLSFNMTSAT